MPYAQCSCALCRCGVGQQASAVWCGLGPFAAQTHAVRSHRSRIRRQRHVHGLRDPGAHRCTPAGPNMHLPASRPAAGGAWGATGGNGGSFTRFAFCFLLQADRADLKLILPGISFWGVAVSKSRLLPGVPAPGAIASPPSPAPLCCRAFLARLATCIPPTRKPTDRPGLWDDDPP